MGKSILLIDTPEKCCECFFLDAERECCLAKDDLPMFCEECSKDKPDWCPLIPMPKKNEEDYITEFGNSYQDGWNNCIKKILDGR